MELITYLEKFDNVDLALSSINAEYGINVRKHAVYQNLVLFKYSQINSPMSNKIVQECRGVILDSDNKWSVVCRPFDKFFNFNEPNAARIDWNSAKILEKLDGTLISLYWYNNKWNVATSGSPDASGCVHDNKDLSFSDLVFKIFNEYGTLFPIEKHLTFMFELTSPHNKIVVDYKTSHLTLIGARSNMAPYNEIGYDGLKSMSKRYGWNLVYRHDINVNIDDIISYVNMINPTVSEGVVVVDDQFNRVKVKSREYVVLHKMANNGNIIPSIINAIVNNEVDELVAYMPQHKQKVDELVASLNKKASEIDIVFNTFATLAGNDRKKFAELVLKHNKDTSIHFSLYSKRYASARDAILSMHHDKIILMMNHV